MINENTGAVLEAREGCDRDFTITVIDGDGVALPAGAYAGAIVEYKVWPYDTQVPIISYTSPCAEIVIDAANSVIEVYIPAADTDGEAINEYCHGCTLTLSAGTQDGAHPIFHDGFKLLPNLP